MWKTYSFDYIKRNKALSMSVAVAALIATLLLSLLLSIFYNMWVYEIQKIVAEEGDWQVRVSGAPANMDVSVVKNFANTERVSVNADLSDVQKTTLDIVFKNAHTAFEDAPLIARQLGLENDAVEYHRLLLSRYLIHDPTDPEPPMLMTLYLVIFLVVALSLVLIIHNSFAVGMNARVHQFGILSSVGATPGQIRTCLMQEAAVLCTLPILAGTGLGVALGYAAIGLVNRYTAGVAERQVAVFSYHPAMFVITLLVAILTVALSAWIPARRLSKLTPLQAIRSSAEAQMKRKRHSRVLSLLFGIEGELAGNALKAQKKALRTSTLSLTLSFLGFTVMLCFLTLSGISTNHTYFERYQDAWDIMITLPETNATDFSLPDEVEKISDIEDITIYQKAYAVSEIPAHRQSEALLSLGGLPVLSGRKAIASDNQVTIPVSLVIMDDDSFLKYCAQVGVTPDLGGSIVLNQVWDSANSNFRYKSYVPYLDETQTSICLASKSDAGLKADLRLLGFAYQPPTLREEYENYALVQFLPLTLWRAIAETVGGVQADTYVRVLTATGATPESLNALEKQITQVLSRSHVVVSENRMQEKESDDLMREGQMVILGAFCVLLAAIGIANVFFYTLSFLRQRKREFARYMSVGMDSDGIRQLFAIEALVIAGRPIIITLPITLATLAYFIRASYLDPMEFIEKAPIVPIAIFILAIAGFVALAYGLGSRNMLRDTLADILREDS